MLYFLYGQNSFLALKKIKDIKSGFLKKNPSFLIEEIDGEEDVSLEHFYGSVQSSSLFGGKRLFIFKNTIKHLLNFEDFLKNNIQNLKVSENIFVFWEKDIEKSDESFLIFEKHAEKTQEVKLEKILENTESKNNVFRMVDEIFGHKDAKIVFVLQRARSLGIISKNLINVIFWKFKRKTKLSQREAGLAYETMLTDMNLKMDSKNERENLERLTLSISKI